MRKILCKDKKEIELVNKVFKNCNYLRAKGKITLREVQNLNRMVRLLQ